jgi:hypothetical protein
MVEPPDGALPPFEALDRFSDPTLLKTFDPAWPLVGWWVKKFPNCEVTNPFFERLYREELVCFARHQSPAAPWSLIPGAAWRYLRILDWGWGVLARVAENGSVAEKWFEARIASASAQEHLEAVPQSRVRRQPSQAALRDYLTKHHAGVRATGREPTERDDIEAARRQFPNVPRAAVRKIRKAILPGHLLKTGRRSAVSK